MNEPGVVGFFFWWVEGVDSWEKVVGILVEFF